MMPNQEATTKPAYYCMACPETFADAATSNAHHDATGHNQTWRESMGYASRQAGLVRAPESPTPHPASPARQPTTPAAVLRSYISLSAAAESVKAQAREALAKLTSCNSGCGVYSDGLFHHGPMCPNASSPSPVPPAALAPTVAGVPVETWVSVARGDVAAPAPTTGTCLRLIRVSDPTHPRGWHAGVCEEPLPCRYHPAAASPSGEGEPGTEDKLRERFRKLVANHELVAMNVDTLGATELGDAEQAVLAAYDALTARLQQSERDRDEWMAYQIDAYREVQILRAALRQSAQEREALEDALAKRCLADMNAARENPNDWPAGQEWDDLVGSSQSIFRRRAREEAGIAVRTPTPEREALFTADEVLDLHAVDCWDGGRTNRPTLEQQQRASVVLRRAMDARRAATPTPEGSTDGC